MKILRGVAIFLSVFLGIIVITLAVLLLLPNEQWQKLLEFTIEKTTDYDAEIKGDVDVKLLSLSPSLKVNEITLRDPKKNISLLTSHSLGGSILLTSIFSDYLKIEWFDLKDAVVNAWAFAKKEETEKAEGTKKTDKASIPYLAKASVSDVKIYFQKSSDKKPPSPLIIKNLDLVSSGIKDTQSVNGAISYRKLTYDIEGNIPSYEQLTTANKPYKFGIEGISQGEDIHKFSISADPIKDTRGNEYSFNIKASGPTIEPFIDKDAHLPIDKKLLYSFVTKGQVDNEAKQMNLENFRIILDEAQLAAKGKINYENDPIVDLNIDIKNPDSLLVGQVAKSSDHKPQGKNKESVLDNSSLPLIPMELIPSGKYEIALSLKKTSLQMHSQLTKNRSQVISFDSITLSEEKKNPYLQAFGQIEIKNKAYFISMNAKVPGFDLARLSDMIMPKIKEKSPVDIVEGGDKLVRGKIYAIHQLHTNGKSMADLAHNLHGKINFAIEQGQIQAFVIEALDIDIVESAASLFGKNAKTSIQCGYGDVDINQGFVRFNNTFLATPDSNVRVDGLINLQKLALWLLFNAKEKDRSITGMDEPLVLSGPFKSLSIGYLEKNKEGKTIKSDSWFSSVFGDVVENIEEFFTEITDEGEIKSGFRPSMCELYASRIDKVRQNAVLAH